VRFSYTKLVLDRYWLNFSSIRTPFFFTIFKQYIVQLRDKLNPHNILVIPWHHYGHRSSWAYDYEYVRCNLCILCSFIDFAPKSVNV